MARMKMGMGMVGIAAVGGVAWYLWSQQRQQQQVAAAAAAARAQPTTGAAVGAIVGNLTQAITGAYDIYQSSKHPTALAGFGARPFHGQRTTPSFDQPRPGALTMVSTPSMPAPRTLGGGSSFGQAAHWHAGELYHGGVHDNTSGVQGLWF